MQLPNYMKNCGSEKFINNIDVVGLKTSMH